MTFCKKNFWILVLIFMVGTPCHSQSFKWPDGKKAAIVLTYDDGINSQLQIAIPQLNKAGFKGTFFIDGSMPDSEILEWRKAAEEGHELANHTLYHPCSMNTLKLRPRFANENYDAYSIIREIYMMNNMLFAIDGKTERTYAYPCCETVVGGKDYVDTLKTTGLVTAARIGGDKVPITNLKTLDLYRVPSWPSHEVDDAAVLIDYVQKVADTGGLGVFQFHGIGGDYLITSAEAHQGLVDYLKKHPEIWVATFKEVTDYIATFQK